MPADSFTHFVFVDFENVPTVDLGLVAGKAVHVTLLIGKKQTWLDLSLVQQMRRVHDQVDLVEVGASGRNALDLTLACYLGQAVQRSPGAEYFIVSKDKDFEAMIGHLQNKGAKVTRHDSLAALPFLAKPSAPVKSTTPLKIASAKATSSPRIAATPKKQKPDEKFLKLITHLKLNHPKTQATLTRSIATFYGNKLQTREVESVLNDLKLQNILSIDAAGKVSYR